MDKKPSVFLSHNHNDKPFVKALAKALRNEGIDVWIDEAEILAGDSLIKKIGDAIDRIDYVIAVVSPNSVKSPWVQFELEEAMTREISGRKMIVLPIRIDDCEMPNYLKHKAYCDFTNLTTYSDSLKFLLRSIYREQKSSEDIVLAPISESKTEQMVKDSEAAFLKSLEEIVRDTVGVLIKHLPNCSRKRVLKETKAMMEKNFVKLETEMLPKKKIELIEKAWDIYEDFVCEEDIDIEVIWKDHFPLTRRRVLLYIRHKEDVGEVCSAAEKVEYALESLERLIPTVARFQAKDFRTFSAELREKGAMLWSAYADQLTADGKNNQARTAMQRADSLLHNIKKPISLQEALAKIKRVHTLGEKPSGFFLNHHCEICGSDSHLVKKVTQCPYCGRWVGTMGIAFSAHECWDEANGCCVACGRIIQEVTI